MKESKFRENPHYEPLDPAKARQFGKFVSDGESVHVYGLDHFVRMPLGKALRYITAQELEQLSKAPEGDYMQYILRSFGPGGHVLGAGDLLKLGRIKFFVRELSFHGQRTRSDSDELFMRHRVNATLCLGDDLQQEHACRVCLCDTQSVENPLVSCCQCRGSVQQIHVECLKVWLTSKLQKKEGVYSVVFNYKNFECEICNAPQPKSLVFTNAQHTNQIVDLLEQSEPDHANQLVLETLNKENNLTGALHIVQFHEQNDVVKIGRGSDSDIRISDISVSRCHTFLKLLKDGIYVADNSSKFGTLLRVRDGLTVRDSDEGHAIQMGRTLLSVSFNKSFNFAKMLTQLHKEPDKAEEVHEKDIKL